MAPGRWVLGSRGAAVGAEAAVGCHSQRGACRCLSPLCSACSSRSCSLGPWARVGASSAVTSEPGCWWQMEGPGGPWLAWSGANPGS